MMYLVCASREDTAAAVVHAAMQLCCVQRHVQKGANLHSHFSSTSYQVITVSPLKYQHGAGTLVMVEAT